MNGFREDAVDIRQTLYDEICRTLTEFEDQEYETLDHETFNKVFYNLLVAIQINWDEITRQEVD